MSITTTDPLEAEALGEEFVTATHLGRAWRIPADVDTWPLDYVRYSIGYTKDGKSIVNHIAIAQALEELLGDQWDDFMIAAPRRRDLIPASQAFAAAIGIGASNQRGPDGQLVDRAFGSVPRLLAVLASWPTAVESDLARFWNLDYRDRWRFEDGRRRLTLRQIHARLSHLPTDSALAVEMGRRSPVELLLMDIYEPLAHRVHPARPLTPEQAAERHAEANAKTKARADYEARRVAQGHRRVSAGLENARANASRGR
jgi:hypothetical protein